MRQFSLSFLELILLRMFDYRKAALQSWVQMARLTPDLSQKRREEIACALHWELPESLKSVCLKGVVYLRAPLGDAQGLHLTLHSGITPGST